MLSENEIQQLEDYQYYRLSSDERKAIEQRMKKDPAYKKEAKAYLHLFKSFQVEKLAEDMRKWDEESASPTKVKFFRFSYLAIAASVVLLFSVGGISFNRTMQSQKFLRPTMRPTSL